MSTQSLTAHKRYQFLKFLNTHLLKIILLYETKFIPRNEFSVPSYSTSRTERLSGQDGGTTTLIGTPPLLQQIFIRSYIAQILTVVSNPTEFLVASTILTNP